MSVSMNDALLELFRAQTQLTRDFAEACSDGAAVRAKMSPLLHDLLQLYEPYQRMYDQAWRELASQAIEDEDAAGKILLEVAQSLLRDFNMVHAFCPHDPAITALMTFNDARAALQRMETELQSQWPWLDHAQIADARAANARGDWQDAGDILRELQSQGSEGN